MNQRLTDASERSIELIGFAGGDIPAVRRSGHGWLAVNRVCASLGVDGYAQKKRIDRSAWSMGWTSMMDVQVPGDLQTRAVFCLRIERVAMWLATLETSRVQDPAARRKIELWQCHAADALDRWWRGEPALPQELPAEKSEALQVVEHLYAALPPVAAGGSLLHAVARGQLEVDGFPFACFLLSDGTRVLSTEDLYAAFGKPGCNRSGTSEGEVLARLPAALSNKAMARFISPRLLKLLKPVLFQRSAQPGRDLPDAPVSGSDPDSVTEVCIAIRRAVSAHRIKPWRSRAVAEAERVLFALAQKPWSERIDEACGVGTALAKPAVHALQPVVLEPYEAIADAVALRLRERRETIPVSKRILPMDYQELRRRLVNMEQMIMDIHSRLDGAP